MEKLHARLLSAIAEADPETAFSVAEQLVDVNYQTDECSTALHMCVSHNALDIAAHLLTCGANVMLMPLTLTSDNKWDCALILALKMGREREDMQVLLLRGLRHAIDTASGGVATMWNRYEMRKIGLVPHYALLWGTPKAFYAAIEHDGDANRTKMDEMPPLMMMLRNLVIFEANLSICHSKMEDAFDVIRVYPEVLWHRFMCGDMQRTRPSLCDLKKTTALGMILSESLPYRISNNNVLKATLVEDPGGKVEQDMIEQNQGIIDFFEQESMPRLMGLMMLEMNIALAMSTHARLGNRASCVIGVLGPDAMKTVFDVLLKNFSDAEKMHMFC